MLKHVSVRRALSPTLHLLLGLGNDVHSKHKERVQKRIETLFSNEITAQNMSLLARIKLDGTMIARDDLKKETSAVVEHRSNVISRLKIKNVSREDKK